MRTKPREFRPPEILNLILVEDFRGLCNFEGDVNVSGGDELLV
jgi:hypothetical protein